MPFSEFLGDKDNDDENLMGNTMNDIDGSVDIKDTLDAQHTMVDKGVAILMRRLFIDVVCK